MFGRGTGREIASPWRMRELETELAGAMRSLNEAAVVEAAG